MDEDESTFKSPVSQVTDTDYSTNDGASCSLPVSILPIFERRYFSRLARAAAPNLEQGARIATNAPSVIRVGDRVGFDVFGHALLWSSRKRRVVDEARPLLIDLRRRSGVVAAMWVCQICSPLCPLPDPPRRHRRTSGGGPKSLIRHQRGRPPSLAWQGKNSIRCSTCELGNASYHAWRVLRRIGTVPTGSSCWSGRQARSCACATIEHPFGVIWLARRPARIGAHQRSVEPRPRCRPALSRPDIERSAVTPGLLSRGFDSAKPRRPCPRGHPRHTWQSDGRNCGRGTAKWEHSGAAFFIVVMDPGAVAIPSRR
jgi:hypothetical protein